MPNFTTEDLLVYMYDEMKPDELNKLEQALQTDWALKQKYQVLIEAQGTLHQIKFSSPSARTILSILQYAESNIHLTN